MRLWERISDALYLTHIFIIAYFLICISSFRSRHITVVNLHRTQGQSCTSVPRQAAFSVLFLKSGEKDAWKSVQIQSLYLLFHLGNTFF